MKTTEKHSQLNEFRMGCAQQSGSLFLEWTINLETKCKADRTAQRVILMPNISVSHY